MRIPKRVLIIGGLIVAIAALQPSSKSTTAAVAKPVVSAVKPVASEDHAGFAAKEATYINNVKDAVRARLRDPGSAVFSVVVMKQPMVACGFVNARNGFGGMAGEAPFVTMRYQVFMREDVEDFDVLFKEICLSKSR